MFAYYQAVRALLPLVSLLFILAGGPSSAAASPDSPNEFTLTILHTNDLHGHIFPFAYTEIGRRPKEDPSRGGAARRATLIRRLKRQIKNPVLLVDSGDTFTRGPLTNAYEGIADTEAMNALGYDLAAIGNNEFKARDGIEQNDAAGSQAALLGVIKRSRFQWLCANATDVRGAFLEGVQPYVVRLIHGVRVGFLGLTAPRSASYPQTKGWTISDPIAAAKTWIPLARQHCDILIAMTHIGVDMDRALASQTTGLDAIVGGDSHTYLYNAVDVANSDGVNVPVVQDGEFGVDLGRFDLHFMHREAGGWKLENYRYKLLPVGPNLREAPDVAAVLAPYRKPFDEEIGYATTIARTPEGRTRQTTRIVAEALRQQTGADLAFNPEGAGFFEVFRTPVVTRYQVYAIMPFKNHVVTANLTGAEIAAMEGAVPKSIISGSTTHLDPAKTYKVALVDFISHDSYKLPAEKVQDTGRDLRDVVIAYLRLGFASPYSPGVPVR